VDLYRFNGSVTTPVNGFDFIASAADNRIRIDAQGTDTNIDIDLVPKGSGVVRISNSPISEHDDMILAGRVYT
jgi:hypothetical protein